MKNEIVKSLFWTFFWLLLLLALCGAMCSTADAQVSVHTQGSRHRYTNGTTSFNRTTTVTSVAPIAPLLYINPYYEKAKQMDAVEESRRCVTLILDAIHTEAWKSEYRERVNDMSADDQTALRRKILDNELCFDAAMLERFLDEVDIARTLAGETP